MPSWYVGLSGWFLAHKWAMALLIIAAGLGLPAFAVFGQGLPRPSGLVMLLWWLVCSVVWFRADRPEERPTRPWVWLLTGFLDLWAASSIVVLATGSWTIAFHGV